MKLTLFLLAAIAAAAHSVQGQPAVFCFWGSWSVYRYGLGTFTADMIPASLCTHLVYAFAGLDPYTFTIKSLDPWCDLSSSDGGGLNNYANAVATKLKNPSLKVLLSIGGWNEGSVQYSQMVSSPSTRKTFIDSVVAWLIRYRFDGLDIDWEYPAERGGQPLDKYNFPILLQEMREAFDPYGFVLSVTLGGTKGIAEIAYNVPEINKHVDYMNVMAYEYHNYYDDPHVRHQSPMSSRPDEDPTLNVNFTMRYFLEKGASPEKLLLGIVSDARTYTLSNIRQHDIGDAAVSPGNGGSYTQSPGYLSAYELCDYINGGGWDVVFDETAQAPYSYGGNQWAAYDNEQSVQIKVGLVTDLKLGGVMFWSLDMDDCHHICSADKECYLLASIHQFLYGKTAT